MGLKCDFNLKLRMQKVINTVKHSLLFIDLKCYVSRYFEDEIRILQENDNKKIKEEVRNSKH